MTSTKVGVVTLDYCMRVKQLDIGSRSYTFKEWLELSPGTYDVFVNGPDVSFRLITAPDISAEDQKLLDNMRERSEHQ